MRLATRIDGSVRSWDTNIRYKKYVNEAKRRKLSCGVPELSQSNNRNTCTHDPKKCKQSELCVLATRIDGSVRSWDTKIHYKKYVNEAKRRKLSCGVPELSTNKFNVTHRNWTIIGSDILPNGITNITERQCIDRCNQMAKCQAVSYITKWQSCWLKPITTGLQRKTGVNTTILKK